MSELAKNIVRVSGDADRVRAFCEAVAGADGSVFSFDAVLPMPQELNVASGSLADMAYRAAEDASARSWLEHHSWPQEGLSADLSYLLDGEADPRSYEDALALGALLRENEEKYGARDWSGWRTEHWGSEWDAVYTEAAPIPGGMQFSFETPWRAPVPVLWRLAELFPDLTLSGLWAGEARGKSAGGWSHLPGQPFALGVMEEDSPAAKAFAALLWEGDPAEAFDGFAAAFAQRMAAPEEEGPLPGGWERLALSALE